MILNSKRIKELETENEELKTLIQSFTAKETQLKRFDELIKKVNKLEDKEQKAQEE